MEAGQRLQVTFVGKGLKERLGASSEAQMRLKTMPLQVDSVLRYQIFPEALRREASTGRR